MLVIHAQSPEFSKFHRIRQLDNKMILFTSFCAILLVLASFSFIKHKWETRNLPPGPWGIPMIGFLIHFVIGGCNYARKLVAIKAKYGKIATVRMGSFKCIWLNDYKLIREAWANPVFCGRPKIPGTLERMHGFRGGIIFNEGPDFGEQRRFTNKTLRRFGLGRLAMESFISEEVAVLIKSLLEIGPIPISTRHLFNIASINALWRITTGERIEFDDPKMNRLADTLNRNMELNEGAKVAFFMPWLAKLFPSLSGWNSYLQDANEIFDFWRDYTNERISKFKCDQIGEHSNFIDAYIHNIQDCQDETSSFYGVKGEKSLAATLQDLFIAGIETTATTMAWASLYLAVFPNVQEKLFCEIIRVVGHNSCASLADRSKMPYAEAFLQETLRFGTLAPLGFIHRVTETVYFHEYLIPKDTIVQANICAVHGDPEYWGDPQNFRPERFLSTTDGKLIKHEALLPFSSGKRLCLGENLARDELFLFLTSIVQRFLILPDPMCPNPRLEPKIGVSAIPQNHKLIFKERK